MKNGLRIFALTTFVLAVGLPSTLSAQDWPQWRGPNRAAVASGFQAPSQWPDQLSQKWNVTVGEGVATPALVGDKLYVFSRQNGEEILRCLNAADGEELWKNQYPSQGADGPARSFSGPRSSPAVAQGKVITFGVRGTLSCLDAATGELAWRKHGSDIGWPRFHTSSSPLVASSLCIAQLGGEEKGAIAAYDLRTGEEKWKWDGDGTAYASPILHSADGADMVVAETARKIVGLDAATGRLLWEIPYAVEGRGYNSATPIMAGNTLYYSGSNRGTKAATIKKSGRDYSVKPLWSNGDASVQYNTPVLKGNHLFGLTDGNELFCLNAETGATAWTASFPTVEQRQEQDDGNQGRRRRGGRGGYGSIVDAGSVLVGLTPQAQLIVFEPSTEAFKQIASYKVGEEGTHAYPILSEKRIIVKDADSVILWMVP